MKNLAKTSGLGLSSPPKVRELMRPIVSVDISAKVRDAARIMSEKGIGSIIVNKDGRPFGIVTEADLVSRIVAGGADPSKVSVAEVMTAPVATIDIDATLVDASRRMLEKQVKRLCVKDRDQIVGIISQTDIIHALTDLKSLARIGLL